MDAVSRSGLSRRERQIMEILLRKRVASVAEIRARLSDPPGYSAVRATVNTLERKAQVSHVREGKKYLYSPVLPRSKAVQRALRHLLATYFDDSPAEAVAALVKMHGRGLKPEEIGLLVRMIRRQRN